MKQYYNNGPEGMPRVERMSDSTLDWVINGVDTNGMYLDETGHRKLRDVCHAVAEETLARISWPARPAVLSDDDLWHIAGLVASMAGGSLQNITQRECVTRIRASFMDPDTGRAYLQGQATPERIHLGAFTVVRDDSLPADVAELRDERGAVARFTVTAGKPVPRQAPWPDFHGQPIREGDTIRHPHSGERGRVVFDPQGETEADQWRVRYGTEQVLARLVLQVDHKGQAVVDQEASKASQAWGDNYMLQVRYPDGSWQPSGHLARPLQEAIDLAERMNTEGGVRYRVVPWDGK